MGMKTSCRGRVDALRNVAIAVGPAGLGSLLSTTSIRRQTKIESMRDGDVTSFHDTIAILGQATSMVPVGIATFLCVVSGQFKQPSVNLDSQGSAQADASFSAQAMGPPRQDQDAWNFPGMGGPQAVPVQRILTVTTAFIIGQPIRIAATLNAKSHEISRHLQPNDLFAALDLTAVLRPIIVKNVKNPRVKTLTKSNTKYYAQGEPGAKDVLLRSVSTLLQHS